MYRNLALEGFPTESSYYINEASRQSGRLLEEPQSRRLKVERLIAHGRPYIFEDVQFELTVNWEVKAVVRVYILPKYRLDWIKETPEDMQKLLRLTLSQNAEQWLHFFGNAYTTSLVHDIPPPEILACNGLLEATGFCFVLGVIFASIFVASATMSKASFHENPLAVMMWLPTAVSSSASA